MKRKLNDSSSTGSKNVKSVRTQETIEKRTSKNSNTANKFNLSSFLSRKKENTPKTRMPSSKKLKPIRLPGNARNNVMLQKAIILGSFIIVILVVLFLSIFFLTRKNATEVFVNGNSVGVIKDMDITSDDIVKLLKEKIESSEGTKIDLQTSITVKKIHAGGEIITSDALVTEIKKNAEFNIEGYVIYVDENKIGAVRTNEEAQAIFDSIFAQYQDSSLNISGTVFVEKVEAVKEYIKKDDITQSDKIKETLTQNRSINETYTVVSGDNLSKVAAKNNMTLEEIYAANPNLNPKSIINPGLEINVTRLKPFVSVKTFENKTNKEVVKCQVEEVKDSTLAKGTQKVIQQGQDGQREVTIQTVRVNGIINEEKEIKETIIKDPVNQIVAIGTS